MANIPFSVATSVYKNDNPEYFKKAMDSLLNGTVLPSEIILIVDGPIPQELEDAVNEYESNKLFNIIRFEENKGLGIVLKTAVEMANNELIARMDSDDICLKDRFSQQLKYFEEHPEVDVVGGDITEFVGEEENIICKRELPRTDSEIKRFMKSRNSFNHMTVMYKKSAVLKAGNYQHLALAEDYYLWIRMMKNGCTFANTGTVLVNVRAGKDLYRRRSGIKYFNTQIALQKNMLKNGQIGIINFINNITKRFIVHVLLGNSLREFVYKNFARSKK